MQYVKPPISKSKANHHFTELIKSWLHYAPVIQGLETASVGCLGYVTKLNRLSVKHFAQESTMGVAVGRRLPLTIPLLSIPFSSWNFLVLVVGCDQITHLAQSLLQQMGKGTGENKWDTA